METIETNLSKKILKNVADITFLVMIVCVFFDCLFFHGCLYRIYSNNYRTIDILDFYLILAIISFVSIGISLIANAISYWKIKNKIYLINLFVSIFFIVFVFVSLFVVGVL